MCNMTYTEIYNQILRKLSSVRWLQKWGLNKDIIEKYIKSTSFTTGLNGVVSERNFTCSKTLELCHALMDEIAHPNVPFDWLQYIYQYTLNKSFPEAVSIILFDSLNSSCEIYLRVLRVLCEAEKYSDTGSFKSTYAMHFLTPEEESKLENVDEYNKFLKAYKHNYTYELMKLSEEVMKLTTLDHVCGVHYLSLYIARQLKELGVAVDLGRVSGAAAGHDIGKYGCKLSELKRVPRLHYYYTDQWYKRYGINYIRNIAINHSTWDLELENLPIESLILIYSDFRVKNDLSHGIEVMRLFNLDESFHVILSKLENIDENKLNRYKKVYAKLKDFENFIISMGVNVLSHELDITKRLGKINYSLLHGDEIVENIKYLAIKHNINLMYELRDEYSLDSILESARSDTDWKNLREYIRLLEEYSTYLTQKQKLQTINFLFDNLVHPEDDIRRHCAELLGTLIAIFDEDYRKEIPQNVKLEPPAITSTELFRVYLLRMLQPGHKTIEQHKFHLRYNISIMVSSLFKSCSYSNLLNYRNIILNLYSEDISRNGDMIIFLIETSKYIPLIPEDESLEVLYDFLLSSFHKRSSMVHLATLEACCVICRNLSEESLFIKRLRDYLIETDIEYKSTSENLLLYRLSKLLKLEEISKKLENYSLLNQKEVTDIFLSNLKSATDWVRKRVQVDALYDYAIRNSQSYGLHTAIHFCNLLKVSEVECVRNHAGEAVLRIMPYLSPSERNELVIELLRALEIEGNRFTEYIPYYAGRMLLWLKPNELDEAVDDFAIKIKKSNSNLKSLILKTIGIAVSHYSEYREKFNENEEAYNLRLLKFLGIVLNGLGDYNTHVQQYSFSVIGKYIFASKYLNIDAKVRIFRLIAKKVLTLISGNSNEELLFLTNSAGLNNIYRFISEYTFINGSIDIPIPNKVAFFPGTFDPFSLSHKEIVRQVRDMGFEVFLAVDEFSWSKKTLPSKLRRNILNMSIADEFNIFIFPSTFPINIGSPDDLRQLRESFSASIVYIAVGSDVILNASSYKALKIENSIKTFSHIIFERLKDKELLEAIKGIDGEVITLSLPSRYEDISSTQIRNYIDENRDITSLVDPLAQQYIYDNGFYQREPQEKTVLKSIWLKLEVIETLTDKVDDEINSILKSLQETSKVMVMDILAKPSGNILILKDEFNNNEIIAFAAFHMIKSGMLYSEMMNTAYSQYLRDNSVGQMVLLDGFYVKNPEKYKSLEQILVTETLTFCIEKDYEYAVFKGLTKELSSASITELLKLNGFVDIPHEINGNYIPLVVDMSTPCVLNLDIENIIKEPFRSNSRVKGVLSITRKRLQQSITNLYPGKLVLSFDINILHQFMIKKICEENNVPIIPSKDRQLGDAMCVPYGDILDRYVIPNTVTKALHTEKYFKPDMTDFKIGEFPHYLDLPTQVKVIKSFRRPVILVDNLLHKGYRIQALDPLFKHENLKVQKIIAGIMSGRGKDIMDIQKRKVSSVHFIPRLKLWFSENAMYPFIGGDALWRGFLPVRNLVPSINLIMPYTSPTFIKDASIQSIYNLSKICIENSIEILSTLESEFHILNEKNMNLYSLGQVFTTPRCVDRGNDMEYNFNLTPSYYLKNDLELLKRLENVIKDK